MGADIHIYPEALGADGIWRPAHSLLDGWVCPPDSNEIPDPWLSSRSYTLYGWLAGVRRPELQAFPLRGTSAGFSPDAHHEVMARYGRQDHGWHDFDCPACDADDLTYWTWFTAEELLAADWPEQISEHELHRWLETVPAGTRITIAFDNV